MSDRNEMSGDTLNGDDAAFGEVDLRTALGALRPARPAIDRDRLMFAAGVALGARRARRWRGATGIAGGLLLVTLGWLGPRSGGGSAPSGTGETVRYVYVGRSGIEGQPAPPVNPVPPPRPARAAGAPGLATFTTSDEPDAFAYLALRRDVLRRGAAGLPPAPAASPPASPGLWGRAPTLRNLSAAGDFGAS